MKTINFLFFSLLLLASCKENPESIKTAKKDQELTSSSEKDDQTIPNQGPCGSDHPYRIKKETPDICYPSL